MSTSRPRGASGSATTSTISIKRDGTCPAPAIDAQPQDQAANEGDPVFFEVSSANTDPYQWRKDGVTIPGAMQSAFLIQSAVPAAPSGLAAKNVGGAAALSWQDNSDFETSYTVQRQTYSGTWGSTTLLSPLGPDATAATDAPGPGKHRFRVRCANIAGAATWTSWVTITLK